MAQGTREKKIIALASEFAEALTSGNYKEAYNRAGALNAEVKAGKSEVLQLPYEMIQGIQNALKSYYRVNSSFNEVTKKFYANGKKLADLVSDKK
jgi:putative transfer protein